jgi:DNA-binding transcriptional LysR family regulator
MPVREPDWSLYRTFLAVVREGSFTVAARTLALTQPTVGRQIEALETLIGAKLFTRTPRGLHPTEAARGLIPHAETMATAAAALHRASSGDRQEEVGAIRITTAEFMGVEVLPAILAEFAHAHPRIELELSLSNHNEDLLEREADIAVRMMKPTQKSLIARRVGSVSVGLFAHRRYVDARGLPKTPSELPHHMLIGFDKDFHVLRTTGGEAAQLRREDFRFRTDNVAAQLAALHAGVGITACHVPVARRDADLVPVMPRTFAFKREIWLVTRPDLVEVKRVRLLLDHFANRLKAYCRDDA